MCSVRIIDFNWNNFEYRRGSSVLRHTHSNQIYCTFTKLRDCCVWLPIVFWFFFACRFVCVSACLSVCLHSFDLSFIFQFASKTTHYVNKMCAAIANLAHSSIVPTIACSRSLSLSLNYPSNYYCNNILNHSRVYLSCCFFYFDVRFVLLFLFYFNSIRNCYSIPLLQLLSLTESLPRFITVMLHFPRFPTHAAKYQYKMYANANDTYFFWNRRRSSLSVYFWFGCCSVHLHLLCFIVSIVLNVLKRFQIKKKYLFGSRALSFISSSNARRKEETHTTQRSLKPNRITAQMKTNNKNIHHNNNNSNNDDKNNTNNNGAIIQSKNSSK